MHLNSQVTVSSLKRANTRTNLTRLVHAINNVNFADSLLFISVLTIKLIEIKVILNNKLFYSHLTKSTQWEHPTSGKRYKVCGGNLTLDYINLVHIPHSSVLV